MKKTHLHLDAIMRLVFLITHNQRLILTNLMGGESLREGRSSLGLHGEARKPMIKLKTLV